MLMFFFTLKKKKGFEETGVKKLEAVLSSSKFVCYCREKKKQYDNSVCKASDEGVCYNKEVGLETSWGPFRLDCSKILWTWGEI